MENLLSITNSKRQLISLIIYSI